MQRSCANDGTGRLSVPTAPDGGHPPQLLPALPSSKSVDGLFFLTVLDFWPRDTFLYTIAKGGEVWDAVGVEVLHAVVRSERRCPRPFQRLNDLLYGGSFMRACRAAAEVAELQTFSDIERACLHSFQVTDVLGRWEGSFTRSTN